MSVRTGRDDYCAKRFVQRRGPIAGKTLDREDTVAPKGSPIAGL
jgi:hypothetical protein